MTTRLLTASDLSELIDALDGAERLYVDTEFHAEHRYLPRLYLLQVATETGPVWLVDCSDLSALPRLAEVLCAAEWVVHGGANDIAILADALGGVPDRVWDTQILAGLVTPHYPRRFGDLVHTFTGTTVDKGATLTNWKQRPLSEEQLAYAKADVMYLRPLAAALFAEVKRLGRMDVAEQACAQARRSALSGPDPQRVWRRLHAARSLTAAQASVLRELAAWREEEAKERNHPPRQVLHDGLMLELARNAPTSVEALAQNRRMPKRIVSAYADAIVQCSVRGLERAASDPPGLVQKFSTDELMVTWLEAACRVAAHQQSWSVDLVLPRQLLWDLVLAPRDALPALLDWRASLTGDLVLRAVHGGLSVNRLADGWDVQ